MAVKICNTCAISKPLDAYYRHKPSPDGYRHKCKVCWKSYNTDHYWENPEGNRAKSRAYKESNPEYNQQWRDNNPTYWQEYGQVNREKIAEDLKKWRKANPEKHIAQSQKRRALIYGQDDHYTAEQWIALCDFYNHRCLCCGIDSVPMTVDHVVPIARGGTNTIENLQPLCGPCNSKKHTQTIDYRMELMVW